MKTRAYRIRHYYNLLSGLTHGNQLVGVERGAKVDVNAVEWTAAIANDPEDSALGADWNRLIGRRVGLVAEPKVCDRQKAENKMDADARKREKIETRAP